ncbi:hypothetical protein P4E94_18020 [Pontiellaceae bacterium B12219]|nr:hypothetical protein [Pontiellaceae bacterium B12219]
MDRTGRGFRNVGRKIRRLINGYQECRGLYCIVDPNGSYLDKVSVYCQVGEEGDWVLCGSSTHGVVQKESGSGQTLREPNFRQLESLLYRQGQPVRWRFVRNGYQPRELTRYTADNNPQKPVCIELVPE